MAQTFQEWLDANTSAQEVAEGVAKGLARDQARSQARAEALAEVRAEVIAEARADARQRRLVVRQASLRFGAETGKRLADLVKPLEAEGLASVRDAVVDSETEEELLERASNAFSRTG